MPSLYGISVSVASEGSVLDEHALKTVDERTVGCFVAGVPGKTFEILLTNTLNIQDVSVAITVDNVPIGRYYLAPGQRILPGLYVSDSTTKPFKFRTLVFDNEQSIHNHRFFTWANTGSMEFSIYRCNKTGVERFRPQDLTTAYHNTSAREGREGTPSLSTGDERPMKVIEGVGGVTTDPLDKPYAKIIIRYRPIEILQMQGLVPSASRPSTSSSTAVSMTGQKRSLDSSMFSNNTSRPTQRLRGTHSVDLTGSPHSVTSSLGSFPRQSSQMWMSQPPLNLHSSDTAEEIMLMKNQLRQATDQMNSAMKQMRDSMELMNRSLRQMHILQQRIDTIEAITPFQPGLSPTQSMTLPPIQNQTSPLSASSGVMTPAIDLPHEGEGGAFQFASPDEHREEWQQTQEGSGTEQSNTQWLL